MPERSPTVRERRLGAQLRPLPEIAGLNLDQVIDTLGWSKAKFSRVETARSGIKTPACTVSWTCTRSPRSDGTIS
jgi:hypothetical protein